MVSQLERHHERRRIQLRRLRQQGDSGRNVGLRNVKFRIDRSVETRARDAGLWAIEATLENEYISHPGDGFIPAEDLAGIPPKFWRQFRSSHKHGSVESIAGQAIRITRRIPAYVVDPTPVPLNIGREIVDQGNLATGREVGLVIAIDILKSQTKVDTFVAEIFPCPRRSANKLVEVFPRSHYGDGRDDRHA